jgi:hypothetical protein
MLQMVPDLPATATTADSILRPPGFDLAEPVIAEENKPVAPAALEPLPTKPIWICRWSHASPCASRDMHKKTFGPAQPPACHTRVVTKRQSASCHTLYSHLEFQHISLTSFG